MKHIKLFEELNTKIQEPFYLFVDRLYISNELAHKITPTLEDYIKKGYSPGWIKSSDERNRNFYTRAKDEKGFVKSNHIGTEIKVTYNGMYAMTISIHRGNTHDNEFGHFEYYIGGNSGDYEMHGKNMIRATKECNLHLMEKLYPIVKNIKSFYKRLKNKEGFFNIIRSEIIKNPNIAKDGVPDELEEEFGHMYYANKYNL